MGRLEELGIKPPDAIQVFNSPDKSVNVPFERLRKLEKPRPSYHPVPAVCVEEVCNHEGQCPRVWIKQDFLLRPGAYSDYWSVTKDDRGFIVRSSHKFGKDKEMYRTFIWRTLNHTLSMIIDGEPELFWLAVWVD